MSSPAAPDPDPAAALRSAHHVMVVTGAGISAESGIPTFRDALTGLWRRFDAEDLGTADAFLHDPELVWGWYEWRRMKAMQARPNPGHLAVAELVRHVPRLTLVTQNVDDLHERAGSPDVVHLHGSLHQARCFDCGQPHPLPAGMPVEPEGGRRLTPPTCRHCYGLVRPGVVWFNETMPEGPLRQAFDAAKSCDLLLVVGTSGIVHPAAQLPGLARRAGAQVVQVNPAPTALDPVCNWNLRGAAGDLLPRLTAAAFPTR